MVARSFNKLQPNFFNITQGVTEVSISPRLNFRSGAIIGKECQRGMFRISHPINIWRSNGRPSSGASTSAARYMPWRGVGEPRSNCWKYVCPGSSAVSRARVRAGDTGHPACREVLSVSTKNYDRRDKFFFYRALRSFREYLLLAQDRVVGEHHVRQSDGSWLMREYIPLSDEIELTSIGCRLRLDAACARVEFPPVNDSSVT